MSIQKLTITNFRNIKQVSITPHPKLNFITGYNGAGKTTILEAINALSTSRSFKASSLNMAVNVNSQMMSVYARVLDEYNVSHVLHSTFSKQENSFVKNGKKVSLTEITYLLPVLVISPDVINLLLEGPEQRRKLINWGMFYTYPNFINLWRKFEEIHRQRTAILKQMKHELQTNNTYRPFLMEQLKSYTQVLVHLTYELNNYYIEYTDKLIDCLQDVLKDLLPELEFKINYYPGWNQEQDLEKALIDRYAHDIEAGRSSIGLHRNDLQIRCFNYGVHNVLSRGQLKLLACALKIAQGELLNQQKQHKSIYLIDDLAAELDQEKQLKFAKRLLSHDGQIFMTYIKNQSLDIFESVCNQWAEFFLEQGSVKQKIVDGQEIEQEILTLEQLIMISEAKVQDNNLDYSSHQDNSLQDGPLNQVDINNLREDDSKINNANLEQVTDNPILQDLIDKVSEFKIEKHKIQHEQLEYAMNNSLDDLISQAEQSQATNFTDE